MISIKSLALLTFSAVSLTGLVLADGQLNPTESFVWGPKLQLGADGSMKAMRLENPGAADVALKVQGNSEFNGPIDISGNLKTSGDIYVEWAKMNTIDLDEINIKMYKIHREGEVFVIRNTEAKGDMRYAMFPERSVSL